MSATVKGIFNLCCPKCNTTSVVELALAFRPVDGPAVASPPSNAEAQNETQHGDDAVLENGSDSKHHEAANVKKTGVSGSRDETLLSASVSNTTAPSSCDGVGGENSNGRATEPVFKVKRKSKNGEALELTLSGIAPLFSLHLPNAAKELGISTTSLKKACRHVGVHRWPGRKVRGLESTIDGLERTIVSHEADSGKAAGMGSEITKLQQELNELFHGPPAQITEKMHSPAVTKTIADRRLFLQGWRSKHHNPGRHDINTGDQPNLASGLAPATAHENSTGANPAAKAKKQPEQEQKLALCTDDDPPANMPTQNADKESARPSPREYIRPRPLRIFQSISRLGSRDTEMKASDLEGLLPEGHDIINVAEREVPESVAQAQCGNEMSLREMLQLKRELYLRRQGNGDM